MVASTPLHVSPATNGFTVCVILAVVTLWLLRKPAFVADIFVNMESSPFFLEISGASLELLEFMKSLFYLRLRGWRWKRSLMVAAIWQLYRQPRGRCNRCDTCTRAHRETFRLLSLTKCVGVKRYRSTKFFQVRFTRWQGLVPTWCDWCR